MTSGTKVWEVLEDIERKPLLPQSGICLNFKMHCKSDWKLEKAFIVGSEKAYAEWEFFTGDKSFPVPHPSMQPATAYMTCTRHFDRRTTYGKARILLLDYLIKWFKDRDI